MNSGVCLQCNTVMIDGTCTTCDGAGKTEALVLVLVLATIAVVLAAYATITML